MARRLRILHISDLHERTAMDWMDAERKKSVRVRARSRHRVLGEAFDEIVRTDVLVGGAPDLLCFTGDVADWGLPAEYAKAGERIERLLKLTRVPPDRLFAVPGNHDIQRKVEEAAWQGFRGFTVTHPVLRPAVDAWMAETTKSSPPGAAEEWRDAILKRSSAFWEWLARLRGDQTLSPSVGQHKRLGYRLTLDHHGLPVHLVGLDSAWLAGDEHDAGKLLLTPAQIHTHCFDDDGRSLPGFRLAMLHHPLAYLADEVESRQSLADGVDLVLHGHQHDPVAEDHADPDRTLRVLAAGSLYEGDHGDRWINSFHRIDVFLDDRGKPLGYDITFYGWSPRGHWHRTGALYKAAPDGVLQWAAPTGAAARIGAIAPTKADEPVGETHAVVAEWTFDDGIAWGARAADERQQQAVDAALDSLSIEALLKIARDCLGYAGETKLARVGATEATLAAMARRLGEPLSMGDWDVATLQSLMLLQIDSLRNDDAYNERHHPFTRSDLDEWLATAWTISLRVPAPPSFARPDMAWELPGWAHSLSLVSLPAHRFPSTRAGGVASRSVERVARLTLEVVNDVEAGAIPENVPRLLLPALFLSAHARDLVLGPVHLEALRESWDEAFLASNAARQSRMERCGLAARIWALVGRALGAGQVADHVEHLQSRHAALARFVLDNIEPDVVAETARIHGTHGTSTDDAKSLLLFPRGTRQLAVRGWLAGLAARGNGFVEARKIAEILDHDDLPLALDVVREADQNVAAELTPFVWREAPDRARVEAREAATRGLRSAPGWFHTAPATELEFLATVASAIEPTPNWVAGWARLRVRDGGAAAEALYALQAPTVASESEIAAAAPKAIPEAPGSTKRIDTTPAPLPAVDDKVLEILERKHKRIIGLGPSQRSLDEIPGFIQWIRDNPVLRTYVDKIVGMHEREQGELDQATAVAIQSLGLLASELRSTRPTSDDDEARWPEPFQWKRFDSALSALSEPGTAESRRASSSVLAEVLSRRARQDWQDAVHAGCPHELEGLYDRVCDATKRHVHRLQEWQKTQETSPRTAFVRLIDLCRALLPPPHNVPHWSDFLPRDDFRPHADSYYMKERMQHDPAQYVAKAHQDLERFVEELHVLAARSSEPARAVPAPLPSRADLLIAAIEERSPVQRVTGRRYVEGLLREIDAIHPAAPVTDDALVAALAATPSLVATFARVARAVATYGSEDGVEEVWRTFELLLVRYESHAEDYYTFLGHELLVVLTAAFLRDEKWSALDALLRTPLTVRRNASNDQTLTYRDISVKTRLLDEVRRDRLRKGNVVRTSIHADMLMERHTNGELAELVGWDLFRSADFLLALRSCPRLPEPTWDIWRPWSVVYLKGLPDFVIRSEAKHYAARLALGLGLSDATELGSSLKYATEYLRPLYGSNSDWSPPGRFYKWERIASL